MRSWLLFAIGGVIAVWATNKIAHQNASAAEAAAITAAATIAVAAAVLALGPPALVARYFPEQVGLAGLGAMLVRLFLTLMVGWSYLKVRQPPKQVFMNALVVSYLVCLAAETTVIVRLVQKHWRPPSPNSGPKP